MNIKIISLLLAVAFYPLSGCAQDSTPVGLRVSSSNEDIDVYIVNRGLNGKAVSIVHGFHAADVGRGLRFRFYDKNGVCITCEKQGDRSEDPAPVTIRMQSWQETTLHPNQIVGKSFPLEVISQTYGLSNGCYGFYVEADGEISVDGKFIEVRLVSNPGKVCIGLS